MRTRCTCRSVLLLIALASLGGCAAAAETKGSAPLTALFRPVADVPLGPAMSRVDYQSIDPASRRLFIAGMGAGTLLVFDMKANRLLDRRAGYPKITAVLAVPEANRLYASVPGGGLGGSIEQGLGMIGLSSGNGRIAVFDLASLEERARLAGGVFPDGIAYDSQEQKLFVSDELGAAIISVDARADRVIQRIATNGEMGNVQYDPSSRRIYAPIQTKDELAVIDPKEDRLLTRFSLPGGRHPHGLAISPWAPIGYVACDGDDKLLVVDLGGQKVLTNLPLGRDPDVLALDPGLKRLYVAAESGQLAVFDIAEATAPKSLGIVDVGPHAHSVAVDPNSHRLYLPLADLNGSLVMRIIEPKDP